MSGLLEGFKIGQELIPSIGDAVQLQGQMARSKLYNEAVKDAQMQREMTRAYRSEIDREGDVALQSWQQRKAALTRQKNRAIPYAGSVPIAKSEYDIADKELKDMETKERDSEKDITDLQGRLQKSVEEGFYTEAHATQLYKDHIAANPILDMKYGKQVKDVRFTAKGIESTKTYTSEEIAGSPALQEEAARAGVTKVEPDKQYKWTSHHTPQGVKFTKLEVGPSIEKSQTEDQRTYTALYDKDPKKRSEAQGVLDAMAKRKERISAAGGKPEKPEYTPKQALSRISTIDATIARMKSSGTVDTAMAIQNPMLAALVDTKDPEAVKQAITSLETERAYVSDFAPKSSKPAAPAVVAPKYKTADEVKAAYTAKKITQEEAVGILRKDFGMK